MNLKNTLGVVIGSFVAASSMGALAQGQGAVEVEAFGKRYMTDSSSDMSNGNLLGGSVGYYLTDDVSLGLSYGEYHDIRSENGTGNKNIKGNLAGLDATYHFGGQDEALRPYVSAGVAHQNISNVPARTGRDHSTFANVGTGVKYFFNDNFYARAGLDGMYNIDANQTEWAAGMGVGMNFGGGSKPAPAPAPVAAPEPMPEPVAQVEEPMEMVRVELDVKFDFDKAQVKQESYGDIKSLADFMNQYPQTTTTVEGHTDSKGSDAYNQKLSEQRANAVRAVLVNQYGVPAERVNAAGYGESRPVADNATDAGRAINRRVEAEVEAQIKQ
ncbi:OmpA family protein [Pseudomonas zhanjiangensis]|uniref:OmpA family protein n=1 Tax=Pseudomonas zhanjiangensis TaxID=3239015 RepID=A0ABV3YYS7_9PSED